MPALLIQCRRFGERVRQALSRYTVRLSLYAKGTCRQALVSFSSSPLDVSLLLLLLRLLLGTGAGAWPSRAPAPSPTATRPSGGDMRSAACSTASAPWTRPGSLRDTWPRLSAASGQFLLFLLLPSKTGFRLLLIMHCRKCSLSYDRERDEEEKTRESKREREEKEKDIKKKKQKVRATE